MPYAQVHYPFESKREFEDAFPADFIAEGIDQTRGWYVTHRYVPCLSSGVSVGFALPSNEFLNAHMPLPHADTERRHPAWTPPPCLSSRNLCYHKAILL